MLYPDYIGRTHKDSCAMSISSNGSGFGFGYNTGCLPIFSSEYVGYGYGAFFEDPRFFEETEINTFDKKLTLLSEESYPVALIVKSCLP